MKEPVQCPKCGVELRALLFMGVQPDGYICDECRMWFSDKDLAPLAIVIMDKKETKNENNTA